MNSSMRALLLSTLAMMLAACDPQDGSGVDSRVGLNGLVVDGRIAGATVWVDLNNNNIRDGGEPRAYTDGDGYYSYNPLTGMNYCALPSSAFEFRYCLRHGSSQEGVVIRARGGRDLVTGERLRGTIALQTTLAQAAKRSSTSNIMSPFTSLLAAAENGGQRTALMTALGLEATDLTTDFSAAETAEQLEMLANANVVQAIQHLVSDMSGEGVSRQQRAENQWLIMQTMAAYIVEEGKEPKDFLEDDIAVFTDLFSDIPMAQRTRAAQTLEELATLYDQLSTETPGNDQVEGRLLANEVMYLIVRRAIRENSAAIQIALSAINVNNLVTQFTNDLNAEYDLPAIATALVTNPDVTAAVSGNTLGILPTPWQGSYLVIGFDTGNDTEVFVRYIDGKETDTSGPMSTCIKLDDGDVQYFRGTWAKPLTVKSWIELEDYLGPIVARESLLRKLTTDDFRETVEQSILDEDELKDYTYEAAAAEYLNTSGPNNSARARPRNRDECQALFNDPSFDILLP